MRVLPLNNTGEMNEQEHSIYGIYINDEFIIRGLFRVGRRIWQLGNDYTSFDCKYSSLYKYRKISETYRLNKP